MSNGKSSSSIGPVETSLQSTQVNRQRSTDDDQLNHDNRALALRVMFSGARSSKGWVLPGPPCPSLHCCASARKPMKATVLSARAMPRSFVSSLPPKSSRATSGCSTTNWPASRTEKFPNWRAKLIPGYPVNRNRRQRRLHQRREAARRATWTSTSPTTPKTN